MTRILSGMEIHLLGLHSILSLRPLPVFTWQWLDQVVRSIGGGEVLFGSQGVQLPFWGHSSPLSSLFALTPRGGAAGQREFGELCLGICVWGVRLTLIYCLDAVLSWHISDGLYRACCGNRLAGAEVNACKCNTFCLLLLLLLLGQSSKLASSPRWAGLNPAPLVRETAMLNWIMLPSPDWLIGFGVALSSEVFKLFSCHYSPRKHQAYKMDDSIRYNVDLNSHLTAYGICNPWTP